MALLLTSSSLARSLIRILLIRPFRPPDCSAKSSCQPHGVSFQFRAATSLGTASLQLLLVLWRSRRLTDFFGLRGTSLHGSGLRQVRLGCSFHTRSRFFCR